MIDFLKKKDRLNDVSRPSDAKKGPSKPTGSRQESHPLLVHIFPIVVESIAAGE